MSMMIMHVEMPHGCAAVLEGKTIKFYAGVGEPVFIGTLDDFAMEYPQAFQSLQNRGLIKEK